MPSKKKNKKLSGTRSPWLVRDYSNEPFFVQKAEVARRIVEKYGLPKEFRI